MRYGVLADIHGNQFALDAALAELRRHDVDRYLVLGDLVGYGSRPNECIAKVAELNAVCVVGNHDLMALQFLSTENCIELAQQTLRWTRRVLTDESRNYLAQLPEQRNLDGVVLAHATLDDVTTYTVGERDAKQQLERLEQLYPGAYLLLLGHTHRPLAVSAQRLPTNGRLALTAPTVVNPGAVGQSRQLRPRARAAVVDATRRDVRFLSVAYDLAAARSDLRRVGLPESSLHLRPSPLRRAGRALRRAHALVG